MLALFGHRRADLHRRRCSWIRIAPGARSTRTGCSSRRSRPPASCSSPVQRITTARWSRAVIRFMEGYVAFLPVAFVFLLLSFGRPRPHLPVDARSDPNPGEGDVFQSGVPHDPRHRDLRRRSSRSAICYIYMSRAPRRGPRAGVGREVGREHSRAACATASAKSAARCTRRTPPGQARRVPRRCCSR